MVTAHWRGLHSLRPASSDLGSIPNLSLSSCGTWAGHLGLSVPQKRANRVADQIVAVSLLIKVFIDPGLCCTRHGAKLFLWII